MNAQPDQSELPRWCALCAANGYHKPENCPDRKPDQSGIAKAGGARGHKDFSEPLISAIPDDQ